MRPSFWIIVAVIWCGMSGRGFAQAADKEIVRLKKELAKLKEENQKLKEELEKLRDQNPVKNAEEAKPNVSLYAPEPGKGRDSDKVIFKWEATGSTLAEQPVSLYYAEYVGAPWRLITLRLPKEGTFSWIRPKDVPARVFLSCRAWDKFGKEVVAETDKLISIDFKLETKP